MDELIKQMRVHRLISIGKAHAIFDFIKLASTTTEYKPDEITWACILAMVRN
jgi:hypothetical protein